MSELSTKIQICKKNQQHQNYPKLSIIVNTVKNCPSVTLTWHINSDKHVNVNLKNCQNVGQVADSSILSLIQSQKKMFCADLKKVKVELHKSDQADFSS